MGLAHSTVTSHGREATATLARTKYRLRKEAVEAFQAYCLGAATKRYRELGMGVLLRTTSGLGTREQLCCVSAAPEHLLYCHGGGTLEVQDILSTMEGARTSDQRIFAGSARQAKAGVNE
jgi:hypothetical protein